MKKASQSEKPASPSPAPANVPIIPLSVLLELARFVERIRLRQRDEPIAAEPTIPSSPGPDEAGGQPKSDRADPADRKPGRQPRRRR